MKAPLSARPCRGCGKLWTPKRPGAKYCSDICRCRVNNARMLKGALIRDLALYWRATRRKAALSDLCLALDGELAEMKAAGLPKPARPEIVVPDGRMPRQPSTPK